MLGEVAALVLERRDRVSDTPPPTNGRMKSSQVVDRKSGGSYESHVRKSEGCHFNRGQRAFFFALAYLGWFISPWLFLIATAAVLTVMWRRQFSSDARRALDGLTP